MPLVSIADAARLTKKSRRTIERQMADGRLSFEVDAAGLRVLETSELMRVFGELSLPETATNVAHEKTESQTVSQSKEAEELAALRVRLAATEAENAQLRERVADFKSAQEQFGAALRLLEHKTEGEAPKPKKKRFLGLF